MESQAQNPEFKNNHENFHPCQKVLLFMEKRVKHNLSEGYRVTWPSFIRMLRIRYSVPRLISLKETRPATMNIFRNFLFSF